MKASKIASQIEKTAPTNLAESWDNVGFQIGSKRQDIKKVLTTLDINPEVVKEAIEKEADMIVSHHPYFFRKVGFIDYDDTRGQMTKDLIKNDIVVYSAHTNLDKAENGLNHFMAEKLGLKNTKPLSPDDKNHQLYKLAVYGPEEIRENVLNVLEENHCGSTSDKYDTCTFTSAGESTFRPLEGSNPYLGETDQLERVNEIKIETILEKNQIDKVLREIDKVHPYEEVAYDLFPVELRNIPKKDGLGRIGNLSQKMKAEDFIDFLKEKFDVDTLREAGPRPDTVKKVALCTGAGAEFIRTAKNKGADVYITGDLKYHDAQNAHEMKMWTLDAGHFGTEKEAPVLLAQILKDLDNEIEIITSDVGSDFIQQII